MQRMYYTLIGSLPALPRHFESAQRVPISWLRLTERLRMLEPADAVALERLIDFLAWDRQRLDRTDEDICRRFEVLASSVTHPMVWRIIEGRMRVRTIMSGLRRRRKGLGPPPGVGAVADQISRNWKHPDFHLAVRYPWVSEVARILDGDNPLATERQLLRITWDEWQRLSDENVFSFGAVVLYLARWEVVARWTGRDEAAGQLKIERLATEALGKYAKLYE